MKKKVGIVMGSDSDLPVMRKAADTLAAFGIPFEVHVLSAHRTPTQAAEFAKGAKENGFGAIIAAAGMQTLAFQALICIIAAAFNNLAWARIINFTFLSASKNKFKYFRFVREDDDDE